MSADLNSATNAFGQPVGLPLPGWHPPSLPSDAPIPGRYCRLERLDPGRHATSLHAAHSIDHEGRMWTYLGYGPFGTEADYRAWMAGVCGKNDPLFFAILDPLGSQALGVASYLRIGPQNGSLEIGHLAFSPLLQRTRAATEAVFLMLQQAFDLGYRRCEWKCDALNAPSRAAALRLGFTFEGIFRQAAVVKGRNRDTAWYSITEDDWPGQRVVFLHWLDPANFNAQGKQLTRLSAGTAVTATP